MRRSSGSSASGGWNFRGMFSEYPLPLDAPVYVTHDEAAAYANGAARACPARPSFIAQPAGPAAPAI